MSRIVNQGAAPSQAHSIAQGETGRTKDVALAIVLARLRVCITHCGYTLEALAKAMGKDESYASYISNVLTGEKPLSYNFIIALPDDVEAEFHSRSAEDFGRFVVAPAATPLEAKKQFVAGLFGMLEHGTIALPSKAGPPAKASLPTDDQARRSA